MNKIVLVVAPHPDDETLGLGGTLLKHQADGDLLYWLIMTTTDQHPNYSLTFQKKRARQICQVALSYKMKEIFQLPFLSAQLDKNSLSEIIKPISKIIEKLKPNIIYLPFQYDAHSDHRITFEAIFSCTKSFRHPSIEEILMYETLSETDFCISSTHAFYPNIFIDVTNTYDQKIEILRIYDNELNAHPFPRSIESVYALAKLRGAQRNVPFGESFMLIKSQR